MVPTDYRLDFVVARLIERLEGQRPTFQGDPEAARVAFTRTAEAHVDRAIGEMQGTGWTDEPERHAAFLREEVLTTFLPRYHTLATRMTDVESGGFGFGKLAEPLGRLGMIGAGLFFAWFVLLKLIALPIIWPLVLLTMAAMVSPDIASLAYRRRYKNQLDAIVTDMTRIQDQERAYLSPETLAHADEPPRPRPVRQPESES